MGRWKLSSSPHKRVSSSAHTVAWGTETPFRPLLLSRPQREGCPPRGHLTVIHRPQRLCPDHRQWRLYVPSVDDSASPRCAALTQWQQGTWHEAPSKKTNKKAMAESSSHSSGPYLHPNSLQKTQVPAFFLELSGGGLMVYSSNIWYTCVPQTEIQENSKCLPNYSLQSGTVLNSFV